MEKNYDFRARHWEYHQAGRRNPERSAKNGEVLIDETWKIGCAPDADDIIWNAVRDFLDYLLVSMDLSLTVTRGKGPKTVWIETDASVDKGFVCDVSATGIRLGLASADQAFRAVVHLEDCMNLEGAPLLAAGKMIRRPLYNSRGVHSGCGIDEYPDAELGATVHAGYDKIVLFLKGFDRSAIGFCNINDLIDRAEKFGLKVLIYNYIEAFIHPDDAGAQQHFDSVYGELFRRYPKASGIMLGGESLEFPSRDPHTSGKRFSESEQDGIPDTRPSPGWYPCSDYPAYLRGIEQAVHKAKPDAEVIFSTYNWGWSEEKLRRDFLEHLPRGITLSVCYEIFTQRTLEGLHTPVMDYTISAAEPGYYFTSECKNAKELGIPVEGNVNTAGIGWDFGTVPYVPTPQRWLQRDRNLRAARRDWNVRSHYATHHYGWWNSVAADLGKWSSWEDFEPDYDLLLQKIAVRDYGRRQAAHVLAAWKFWSQAMDYYTASNEDQYGPWRVGPAYPFIFQPNLTRTMRGKEIKFPTAPYAHFGSAIIKTLYQPFENENQSPGFLRYPAEIRSLQKMLVLWDKGLAEAELAADTPNGQRLHALGLFIRNSIRTTTHIKQWWQFNMALQTAPDAAEALNILGKMEQLAGEEIQNARETIPAVETDSRLGWEPSMEYVCDRTHLEWKIRQVESALREIATYRTILNF